MKNVFYCLLSILLLISSCKEHDITGPLKKITDTTIFKMYTAYNSIIPSNQVNTVHANGDFIWLGTASGLVLKNGNLWTVFNSLNSRIPNDNVTAIETDNQKNVWVGTSNGIAVYDGKSWKDLDSINHTLFNNVRINDILNDSVNDLVWLATNKGLYLYNKKTWAVFNSTNSALTDDYIISLAIDKGKKLILTTFDYKNFTGRLWYYDFNTWTYVNLLDRGLNASIPENILVSSTGVIYLTCSSTIGTNLIEIKNNVWKVYNRNQSELFSSGLRDVIEHKGKIVLGYSKGLIEFDGSNFQERTIQYGSNIVEMMVSDLEIGHDNVIYMATFNNGLCEITIEQ